MNKVYVVAKLNNTSQVILKKDDKYCTIDINNISLNKQDWVDKWLLSSALTKRGYDKVNPTPLQDYLDSLGQHYINL